MRSIDRTRKKLSLLCGVAALCGACASSGATPHPFPMPASPPAAPGAPVASAIRPPSTVDDYALVGTALELRGVPYKNGGADRRGFDCSGFTQYVFAQHGISLPRETREQFKAGASVEIPRLKPGDLIFFQTTSAGASHVGIAVGGNEFVHAPSTTGVVRVERLSSSYWATRVIGARRVIAD